jgi:hypothetical protein
MQQHDIFVSYKRGPDEERVEALVGALRANGLAVWWDRDIPPNAPWEETILAALHAAKIVMVCWSAGAVSSENVRSEARWAKERDKLLQIFVEKCEPPLFFGEHQGLMLLDNSEVYGPKFIAVRDAARALIERNSAARASVDVNDRPGQRKQRDKLARQFARDEPASPWEASQFALTLSILTAGPVAALLWMLLNQLLPEVDTSYAVPLLVVATPLAALVGGYAGYAWLARKPRKVGLLRAPLLALTSSAVGAAVVVVVAGVVAALSAGVVDPQLMRTMMGMSLLGSLVSGFVITLFWLPIFILGVRKLLRAVVMRVLVVALAVAAPVGSGVSAVPLLGLTGPSSVDLDITYSIRRTGLAPPMAMRGEDGVFDPEVIAAVRTELGLSSGGADTALLAALRGQGDKSEWRLASDGSGDATSLTDILERSAGNIVVRVAPGRYVARDDAGGDAFGSLLMSRFGNDPHNVDETYRSVHLIGDGDRNQIVFDVGSNLDVGPGSRIENVTLEVADPGRFRWFGPDDPNVRKDPSIILFGRSALVGVQLTGTNWSVSIYQDPSADERIYPGFAEIQDSAIMGQLSVFARGGLYISGTRFTGWPEEYCMIVYPLSIGTTIRGNDFSLCPGGAIAAAPLAPVDVGANEGTRDQPIRRQLQNGLDVNSY